MSSSCCSKNYFQTLFFRNIVGFLIILFFLFTIFHSLNVKKNDTGFVPIIDGYQIIEMTINKDGYFPNYFKVKSDLPVKWKIKDGGISACSNTIISQSLLDKPVRVLPYSVTTLNFTPPKKAGVYHFSCSMGMFNGSIEVIN